MDAMKALLFAAGRGERMRPLTDDTPKPLLRAGRKRLIEWHLEQLRVANLCEVVINIAYLADQFPIALGDGARYGVKIEYSREGTRPLETGGGMLRALPLLGNGPFVAVNADIFTDFDFATLPRQPRGAAELVLVDNPPHHPHGDFGISADGRLLAHPNTPGSTRALTFAGIGVYRPGFLQHWRASIGDTTPGSRSVPPRFPLTPVLRAAITRNEVAWRPHPGCWIDVGTPARLAALDARLNQKSP
jgi:MurNAc alpha-1-phosphate uridylyltransferase